jgi:hypothetical protein
MNGYIHHWLGRWLIAPEFGDQFASRRLNDGKGFLVSKNP